MTTIPYKLAKDLKDAGFPQERDEAEGYLMQRLEGAKLTFVYKPSLSELIEECGDRVQDFRLERRFVGGSNGVLWVALIEETKDGGVTAHNAHGKTPEEAVANLYLALNRKP